MIPTPIIGYFILTEKGTAVFQSGATFPRTSLCLEALECGHTNYTPRWDGKIQVAQSRKCKKCATKAPRDFDPKAVREVSHA